jgi:hypothetical protein
MQHYTNNTFFYTFRRKKPTIDYKVQEVKKESSPPWIRRGWGWLDHANYRTITSNHDKAIVYQTNSGVLNRHVHAGGITKVLQQNRLTLLPAILLHYPSKYV